MSYSKMHLIWKLERKFLDLPETFEQQHKQTLKKAHHVQAVDGVW